MSERKPETIDGETGAVAKPQNRIRLTSIRHVRLEITELYRMVARGEMESGEANRRTWLLRNIADLIFIADIEPRLQAIEERQKTQ